MVFMNDKKVYSDFKNLESMKNAKNSDKYWILSSFSLVIFTNTVWHGGDQLIMKEGIKLDRFNSISCPSETKRGVFRRQIPFFEN